MKSPFPSGLWPDPPAACRPAPLWSWNGAMTRARITSTLEGLAKRNAGGVYIHPRPGLVTEYLSEEWFDLWGFALAECRRLGLGCHIYDENSFPSGFGGGHVLAGNPLAANSRISCRVAPCTREESPDNVRLAEVPAGGAGPGIPALEIVLEKVPPRLWHAGFPMADVCRAEVTRGFLDCTHERYARECAGEMGGALAYVFTDEPETGTGPLGFHGSRAFLKAFRSDHGYALESELPALVGNLPRSTAVRHDYQATLNRLFTENFARQCHDWCGEHGLRFTGHFNEHAWPLPTGSPSTMAAQRWMQTPGLDLLGFQFQPGPLSDAALWLFTVKEAASIAAQCGRGEVLCESCGGGGYDYGPQQMKPLEDFLLALGVNRLAPHLSHQTLAGARKYDWPQTISDHSPWWDAYAVQALHAGRVAAALSAGTARARTLVLNPTTTGWIHYRPECCMPPGTETDDPLETLRLDYPVFLARLYGAQVEFDLGDECVMAELASADAGRLRVGECVYDTVIVPAGMENMLGTTADMLETFLGSGGTVFLAGNAPHLIDGRASTRKLDAHPGWIFTGDDTVQAIRAKHPPAISSPDGSPLPADLLWAHRGIQDGSVVFLANPTKEPLVASVMIAGASAAGCDTRTGDIRPLQPAHVSGGKLSVPLELPPGGHALWRISNAPAATAPAKPLQWTATEVRFEGCAAEEPNVLPLDYCDYEGPGVLLRGIHTTHADTANWRAQGFDRNLWRVSIQYRRAFLDAAIAEPSAFSVRYPFEVDASFIAADHTDSLCAAIERPWLYDIFCNGEPVPQRDASTWFDEEMRLLPLGRSVRAGANVLELRATKFHVLAEIMPVILRGPFRARPAGRGFVLEAPAPWDGGGNWSSAGHAFYPWRVRYSHAFSLPADSRVRVTLPDFRGSAVGLQIDGGAIEWGFMPGSTIAMPGIFGSGPHRLEMLLCGNLKNFLGPHFSEGLPGAWSWEASPASQPSGASYGLQKTGLKAPPLLEMAPA